MIEFSGFFGRFSGVHRQTLSMILIWNFSHLIALSLLFDQVQKSIKEAAKKGQNDVCKILAKEIIASRKAVNKIYSAKAQLNSVDMQLKNQLATIRIAGTLQQSTQVMQGMQALIKVPEIQAVMQGSSAWFSHYYC